MLGPGFTQSSGVYHYAPDRHALERRCAFDAAVPEDGFLVALTSIHWREAWKYGERAFRYCQHDLGHAVAAITVAASQVGWHVRLLPDWSHQDIARLTGIDRDSDYVDAEAEEPGCVLAVFSHQSSVVSPQSSVASPELLAAVAAGEWTGRANQLSEDHVQWTFIDEVAAATRAPAFPAPPAPPASPARPAPPAYPPAITLTRRSAVAFDARSTIDRDRFVAMLARTMPDGCGVWDVLWWPPRVHLALFVHRVVGLDPGLYLLVRERASGERLKTALGREFEHEQITADLPLVRLARGDCRALARRLSCDQDIAADGFFSLGMIADLDASLAEWGAAFYRHLFWETGVVGQVLYLEAEAAGARATGIGCFYDDPVHGVLGLTGHAFQSLYHFSVGIPVEDTRLTTETGYPWEGRR